jgi:hypothetical protein
MRKRLRTNILTTSLAVIVALCSFPAAGTSTAHAETLLRPAVVLKKKKKVRKRRPAPRRGSPEVCRRISREMLEEHLPELARMLGLESNSTDDSAEPELVDEADVDASIVADFSDSELDDEEADEDVEEILDINDVYDEFARYMAGLNGETVVTDNGIDKQVMIEAIWDWVGTRYRFGGTSRNGIDCSAFTGTVYRSLGHKLPRTAAMQWNAGREIDDAEMQFGDLVFFNTRRAVYVSHVGIYLGNNLFAHASSRNGVIVSSLESNYYSSHFIGARRFEVESSIATSSSSADPDDM